MFAATVAVKVTRNSVPKVFTSFHKQKGESPTQFIVQKNFSRIKRNGIKCIQYTAEKFLDRRQAL